AAELQARLREVAPEGEVQVFAPPPVEGLGTAGGFKLVVEDRNGAGEVPLQEAADRAVAQGRDQPGLEGLYTSYRAKTPWLELRIDRTAARARGVPIGEIFNALQVDVGSLYVNDFNRFGRTWQVNVQADPRFRE